MTRGTCMWWWCGITGIRALETQSNNMKAAKLFELLLGLYMSYSTVKHTTYKIFIFLYINIISFICHNHFFFIVINCDR